MGSVGIGSSSSTVIPVVDFGNAAIKEQTVNYGGVQMTRKEADRINYVKDELSYLSYKLSVGKVTGTQSKLSAEDSARQKELQDELRKYRDIYGISVGRYLPGGR